MLRRLVQLYIGLVLYGVSTALFVHANLGADPWDVFHLGVGKQFGLDFGTVIILTGAAAAAVDPAASNAGSGNGQQCDRAGAGGKRDAGRPAADGVAGGAA
jgi:hypothetical protein